jgi:hypothetical protein
VQVHQKIWRKSIRQLGSFTYEQSTGHDANKWSSNLLFEVHLKEVGGWVEWGGGTGNKTKEMSNISENKGKNNKNTTQQIDRHSDGKKSKMGIGMIRNTVVLRWEK